MIGFLLWLGRYLGKFNYNQGDATGCNKVDSGTTMLSMNGMHDAERTSLYPVNNHMCSNEVLIAAHIPSLCNS